MVTTLTEVAIIGGGPAGLTAALYLGRAQVDTVVIDKDMCGGQIISSPLLENVPGYYGSGAELAINILNEVEKYPSVRIENFTDVTEVQVRYDEDMNESYEIMLGDNAKIIAQYVICATGSNPIQLKGIEGPNVHYCVTCDGALYQDKTVAVVGGGNSALQYALELTKYANKIYIVTNENDLRGEEVMQERVRSHSKIEVRTNFPVVDLDGGYIYSDDGEALAVDGVFVAVGYKTNTDYFELLQGKDNKRRFKTDQWCRIWNGDFHFNQAFAIGDCRSKLFNQVVIAMGEGCTAALLIISDLEK